jgi:lipopolysaccharide transport system permease protein/teichoic acid transport system permease protein
MARNRCLGTAGGVLWLFAQPLTQILIYWVVFSLGFKTQTPAGEPYILFFVTGFLPWLVFQEALGAATTVVTGAPHLVRKTTFPVTLLPMAVIAASLVTHGPLLVVALCIFTVTGWPPDVTAFACLYYMVALSALLLGLAWITASLNVYFRDVGQIVTVVLGIWFWLTPVVWPPSLLEPTLGVALDFNPLNYVVQGYRDSLLHGHWPTPSLGALVFWVQTIVLLFLGERLFHRLSRDFAEII